MRIMAVLCTLSLLIGGAALMSKRAEAAGWISGADSYAAPWVKEIEQELLKKEYRYVFGNDPRTPQASVLRLLNQAAKALEAKDSALAGKFVRAVRRPRPSRSFGIHRPRGDGHHANRDHTPTRQKT
jgi:hypothetical protein